MIRSTLRRLRGGRARLVLPVVVSGVAGSLAVALSMGASLSGFAATITNPTNTAATGTLVVTETGTGGTCSSADSTATCSTNNLYGGTTTPLLPGVSQTTAIVFAATGTSNVSATTITPGTCVATSTGGTGSTTPTTPNTTAGNLCSVATLQIYRGDTLATSTAAAGTQVFTGTPATFTSPISAGAFSSLKNEFYTFVVTLPAGATTAVQGQQISQPITWAFS